MSPIVIDARFRSLGSIGPPNGAHSEAGSWPVPQMKRSQSVALLS